MRIWPDFPNVGALENVSTRCVSGFTAVAPFDGNIVTDTRWAEKTSAKLNRQPSVAFIRSTYYTTRHANSCLVRRSFDVHSVMAWSSDQQRRSHSTASLHRQHCADADRCQEAEHR